MKYLKTFNENILLTNFDDLFSDILKEKYDYLFDATDMGLL